jgi:hypothetical protein
MYIISYLRRPSMKVNIHNLCSDFKLTNRGYFSTGVFLNGHPAQEVEAGRMKSFGFEPSPLVFEGVLAYELERRYTKPGEEFELTHVLLFVVWKSEGYRKLRAYINLVEYDEKFYWNNAKLDEYYRSNVDQLSIYTSPIRDTWLTRDGTVFMTNLELDFTQRHDALNIIISESVTDNYTRRPEWINPRM